MRGHWQIAWHCTLMLIFFGPARASRPSLSQTSSNRLGTLFKQAQNEELAGQLEGAEKTYREILRLDSRQPAAYNNLGRLYLEQGRYPEAIDALKHVIAINTRLAGPHALLGITYYQFGNFREARNELETALHLRPDDRKAMFFLARSASEAGDFTLATNLLERLRRDDPKNADVLYALGLVYMKRGSLVLETLQRQHPESYLTELLLGTDAEEKQQHAEAAEHYRKAIAKAPHARGLHFALGNALYRDGQLSEALQEFQREFEIDPYNYMAYVQAALILVPTDPARSVQLVSRALQLRPDLAPGYLVRGRALLALKKPQEALLDLQNAARMDPRETTAHYQLALAYRQLGREREAEQQQDLFENMQNASQQAARGGGSPD